MIDNAIIYEQPLNELIRVCLRLEQLFFQIDQQINDHSISGTRNLVAIIINILQVLDRPDLKAKLAKELSYYLNHLTRLENTPEINQEKLRELLNQLDNLTRCFIDSNGKIGHNLRDIELLNNLRLHLNSPGGACSFDIPLFHYWIKQPIETRQKFISSWLAEFDTIRTSAQLILQLVREGTKTLQKTADQGLYQELLDPQLNLKLVRVSLPPHITAYPEISIGRHFLSIRFYTPNINERPTQYNDKLSFWLAYGN